ncbi:polysaccharide pyruvyl transferase family protein [Methylophaga sp.]|uniref:polysaccharide pyruvyl transferase family protein n=1 Tax=Methylophaga sp. TaxID=2024840 RepID=UPI00271C5F36|nr:polysaccharide pyruvyl transferase family protein [Methylophaga sp.]MDO8828423.1 polysaccharide pyruvyl transferase family protein [Methylophaga sp.]
MLIEIRKAGFTNKGAELMLYAILEKINNRYPNAQLTMAPTHAQSSQPFEKLVAKRFYPKAWLWLFNIQLGDFARYLPSKLREMYGIKLDKEVSVVIDAAGFAYSEDFGIKPTRELYRAVKRWKKNETKIILMPQAFGPFKSKITSKYVKKIIEFSDAIFPRDEFSYQSLTQIEASTKIVKYPDFTCLIDGYLPDYFDYSTNRVAIIPNGRMMDKTTAEISALYLPFLIECIRYLKAKDLNPFILIHEENDIFLAGKIKETVGEIPIIFDSDPLVIKGIIGQCDAIITSRFHGLVSALCQGVPAITTGWSHKYAELLNDYEYPEGIVSVTDNPTQIRKKIDNLFDGKVREGLIKRLTKNAGIQKSLANDMWEVVFSIIDKSSK